ncbi:hypothetical protein EDC56_1760 [Sinobacterium caligoides]|uniref:Uncharacterized protein n=1 Tax=Sinobacterium caligoides TaxID=933926 RepID=A0A3N2DPS7_9GAMM|nr:hypothetical protein [Sinobacterium caligoides]ROS01325.1 hypothetical protein EDC56_1760 [Sinobacterium caligoides]
MWKEVNQYSLNWRAEQNSGIIWLKLADGTDVSIEPDSIEELAALGDILRNEKPIHYNTDNRDLSTSWELVGEGES